MKALRVGEEFWVNADQVDAVQSYGTRAGARELKRARAAGAVHNATRGKKARSLVTLRSGWVVISPHTPETLVSRALIDPPLRPSARFSGEVIK